MIVRRSAPASPAPRPSFLDDDRLDADEIGTLLYLNFFEDGAELVVPVVGRRLHCGTYRFGRILKRLRRLGYIETIRKNRTGRGNGRGAAPADFIVRERAAVPL